MAKKSHSDHLLKVDLQKNEKWTNYYEVNNGCCLTFKAANSRNGVNKIPSKSK